MKVRTFKLTTMRKEFMPLEDCDFYTHYSFRRSHQRFYLQKECKKVKTSKKNNKTVHALTDLVRSMTFEARPRFPTQNTNRTIEAFQIEAQTRKKNLDPGKVMPNSAHNNAE